MNTPSIIGLPTLNQPILIKKVDILNFEKILNVEDLLKKHKDVFEGIGCITNFAYDLKLKEGAKPTIAACRKIPIVLQEQVKNELDKMESKSIIKRVTEPTEWVHPIVISKKKNGKIRICIDPTQLNKHVCRQHYKIPNFEDLSSKLSEAKIFSTLDAERGFYQVKLTEKCSYKLVMITPFGRFRFLRLPFGITSATEVFQECFESIFSDIDGVDIYVDDIRIYGRNQREHDLRLGKVLQRAQERNVKFNRSKCIFNSNEVKYMGHCFTDKGIKIDVDKVQSIIDMKAPKNKAELETFLGMITYVSKFVPNVASKNVVLRNLTKKDVVWNWDENASKEFNELKNSLIKAPILQYFDVKKSIVLSVDASKYGLGSVLKMDFLWLMRAKH